MFAVVPFAVILVRFNCVADLGDAKPSGLSPAVGPLPSRLRPAEDTA